MFLFLVLYIFYILYILFWIRNRFKLAVRCGLRSNQEQPQALFRHLDLGKLGDGFQHKLEYLLSDLGPIIIVKLHGTTCTLFLDLTHETQTTEYEWG